MAAGYVLWALIRLAGLERGFPATALIAYTPYVAILGVAFAIVTTLLEQRRAAVVIALCAALLIAAVAPRALPNGPPDPRPHGPALRVLGVNMMLGHAELAPLLRRIREERIDLVSLAELTPEAAIAISVSPIANELPYAVTDPNVGSSGTGILSRYPLRRLQAPGSEGNDLPTIRCALDLPGGAEAEVFSIHPLPPSSLEGTAQLSRYLDAIPAADPPGPPRLLIGDFNSTLDDAGLRELLDEGYTDAADARGGGLSWTWPQDLVPPPVTIDHVIVDDRVEVLDFDAVDVPGTDHRGVQAALRLPGARRAGGGGDPG